MGNVSTLIYIVDKKPGEDASCILNADEFSDFTDLVLGTLFENVEYEPDDKLIKNILASAL
jgi:hypothetical protein